MTAMTFTDNSEIKQYWDKRADEYDAHQDSSEESRLFEQLAVEYILSLLPAPSGSIQVLDAGGGSGRIGCTIALRGYSVTLTDISPNMLSRAKQRAAAWNITDNMKFLIQDLEDMQDLADEGFDLAFSEFYPVSYCANPEQAVKELARVTRKDGIVIISVMNKMRHLLDLARQDKQKQMKEFAERDTLIFDGRYPCRFFDHSSLKLLMENAGLSMMRITSKNMFTSFYTEEELKNPVFRNAILDLERKYTENEHFHPLGMDLVGTAVKR